jgi:hypothetical protein
MDEQHTAYGNYCCSKGMGVLILILLDEPLAMLDASIQLR